MLCLLLKTICSRLAWWMILGLKTATETCFLTKITSTSSKDGSNQKNIVRIVLSHSSHAFWNQPAHVLQWLRLLVQANLTLQDIVRCHHNKLVDQTINLNNNTKSKEFHPESGILNQKVRKFWACLHRKFLGKIRMILISVSMVLVTG